MKEQTTVMDKLSVPGIMLEHRLQRDKGEMVMRTGNAGVKYTGEGQVIGHAQVQHIRWG